MTTSSSPVRGRALLMSTAAASFVLSAALVAGPALAQNECGAAPAGGGTVTCPGATTFPSGITYTPTADLTLVTQSSDVVNGPITVNGTGAVTVNNAAPVSTTAANSPGIYATSTGVSGVSVTSTGAVSTTGTSTNGGVLGENSDGVVAVATGAGNTTVNVTNVSATGTNSWGVLAENTGTGTTTVTVAQGGTVAAAGDGVALAATPSATGPTEFLYNNGTITAGANAYSVITATGDGAATIDNNAGATLNGPILLEGGLPGAGNTVNNAGTWNVTGNSTFGATGTTNELNNTGTIKVGTSDATFTNLATWNNAGGTVDLTSGHSLTADGTVFNGGQGSTLRVNANSASGVLTIGSTGTGTTNVVLADVPGTNPAMNLNGETLVVGAGNGSFNLGGGTDQRAGFVDYRLVYDSNSSTYSLFGLPGPEVFEALNIPYALQDFWRNSATTLTQRAMSIRDSQVGQHPSRAEGWEFWAQPYGGSDFFKRPQTFSFGGFQFPGIGNHSDSVGLQVGADILSHWGPGSYAYWGFTGGVEQQTTHFIGDDANDLYSVGGNVGMYGGVAGYGFYANAVGKVDFDNMNINFFTAGFSPTNTYKAYGTRGEVGYRWPWQGFFVEPSGRVNAIWTDSINLYPAGAALHFFDDDPVVQAQFGGRVGTTLDLGKWMKIMPGMFDAYVGAWYEDQYSGRNRMDFTTFGGLNSTSIDLAQIRTGTFIHMEYGLETSDWYGGMKLFLKGENDFNGDSVGGWAAQAGVRFNF